MSRKQIHEKYFNSNIFNNDPALSSEIPKVRVRQPQSSLIKTKDDLFNTERKTPVEPSKKKSVKRFDVYSKIFGSDIFCKTNPNEVGKKQGLKKIRNANNYSSCFDSMKNLEEYKKNLEKYTKEKRTEKKTYKPDKYLKNETAAERYYKEIYDPNGLNIIPERCFSADRFINKEQYAQRKKNLKNETNKLNDEASDIKMNPKITKKIYVRTKNKWTDNNSGNYQYIEDSKINPVNKSKINKQIYLQSNLFNNEENNKPLKKRTKTLENIQSRLEEEKNRINSDKRYHISLHEKKRDLTGNDRMLYGAVHSKWEKSKIDWLNPHTEIMFGTQAIKDVNNEFGPKGPNAFQRKLNQLADTKNIDTINEIEKEPLNNIQKPVPQKKENDLGSEKIEKILNEMPNLNQDKKLKIKLDVADSLFSTEKDLENKARTLTDFYSDINNKNKSNKNKKEIADKIGIKKNININNNKKEMEEKCGHDFDEYVLTYGLKGNNFEKFEENDLKTMFEKNGVHIYDIRKNMFDKGKYNMIKFKVRNDKKGEDALKKKLNNIENSLGKNYKVKINKEKKKNFNINSKNFVSNPGAKLGILNENVGVHDNAKFTKIPDNIRHKKNFSKQFENINYKYKNMK